MSLKVSQDKILKENAKKTQRDDKAKIKNLASIYQNFDKKKSDVYLNPKSLKDSDNINIHKSNKDINIELDDSVNINKNKRKSSVDLIIEPLKQSLEGSINEKFEMKSRAPFSYSKPTKLGQIKKFVSTNLMIFQDGTLQAKKNEYDESLNLLKKNLKITKKKYDRDEYDRSLESISHRATRPMISNWEKRAKEKADKKVSKTDVKIIKKKKIPLIEQMHHEVSVDLIKPIEIEESIVESSSERRRKEKMITKKKVQEEINRLLNIKSEIIASIENPRPYKVISVTKFPNISKQ